MDGDAREDPVAALDPTVRRRRRALPALRQARPHPLDAPPRPRAEAAPPHLGVHRVSGHRGAPRARVNIARTKPKFPLLSKGMASISLTRTCFGARAFWL